MIDFTSIKLDSSRPELLYSQLSGELERLILACEDPVGTYLPSAQKLGTLLGINRMTVLKAYGVLEERHLIEHASARRFQLCIPPQCRQPRTDSAVGLILPCSFSYFLKSNEQVALQYISGIIDAATEKSLSLNILSLPPPTASQDAIDTYVRDMKKRLLGIIHIGDRNYINDPPLEQLMQDSQLPQVFIAAYPSLPTIGNVLCDTSASAKILAELLISLNHKRIGLVSCAAPVTHPLFSYACYRRTQEMKEVLNDYGLMTPDLYAIDCQNSPEVIGQRLSSMKETRNLPSIFICQNDDMALWTISALQKLGLRVPDDISVVGYDGTNNALDAGLTTFCQPFYAIGRQAVRSLMDYAEQGITPQNRTRFLQPYLVSKNTLSKAR